MVEPIPFAAARKADEIRIIREIASRIGTTLELGRIFEVALEALEASFGFHHSMILLATGEELTVAASRGYPDPVIGRSLTIGQGVLGVVARRRRITRLGNIGAQRAYLANVRRQVEGTDPAQPLDSAPELPGLPDADSQIGIPLVAHDRLIGVLGVESREPRAFDELDEVLLSIVASQLAHAIDNANLHAAEVERTRALDAANAELTRLNESLERSVAERTAELSRALAEMQHERDLREELLARMAPPAVIPLMLAERLSARRLNVTALFTDLADFTAYTSGMEPDELFAHVNHFFSWAGEVIERYRGYVNKTSGDGLMALFGVPFESSTHQTDAALAGLALQAELAERFPFSMRVGINSGTVAAGMLGPKNRSVYDVLGDAVNVASRMEELCPPGGVAVSPETAAALQPYFALDPLGTIEVKGKGAMNCAAVRGIRPLLNDGRRIDSSSAFAREHTNVVSQVEQLKRDRLAMIDFASIQARDAALGHNEAVGCFVSALAARLPERCADVPVNDLALAALAHDLGKRSIDPERLNRPSLSGAERDALRAELRAGTTEVLRRIELTRLAPLVEELYRFEATRGAEGEFSPAVEMLAVCDIYDALTAPKRYKGTPWRITGALAELARLPWCQRDRRPIFDAFIELMKPKGFEVRAASRERVVLR
jgi:adenylate cyclase